MKPLDTAKIWRATAAFLLGCAVLGVVTAVAFALHSTLEVALLLYIVVILLVSMTGEGRAVDCPRIGCGRIPYLLL